MGILGKLAFWKHDDFKDLPSPELGLGKEHDTALGIGDHDFTPPPGQIPSEEPNPVYPQHNMSAQQPASDVSKDIQILSAKLDSLKAILDNLNQRLANIERIANEAQQSERQDIYERY